MFRAEGVAVNKKQKYDLADLSVPGACSQVGVPIDCNLGSGISAMSEIGVDSRRPIYEDSRW